MELVRFGHYHLLVVTFTICFLRVYALPVEPQDEEDVVALWMPRINTTQEDEYHCLGMEVNFDIRYITQYVPHASAKSVHHILIYGCSETITKTPETVSGAWKCRDDHPIQSACRGTSKFLFAWAKDAPALKLPGDVGFQIGLKTDVKALFLQIHYNAAVTNDDSGISLILTSEPRRYAAGILLMAAGGQYIPPKQPMVNVNIMCTYRDDLVIHPFGFRTHAHSLGTVISGWYMKPEDIGKQRWTLLGKQSPQNPQAFYKMDAAHNITAGTILGARCVFNSTDRATNTFMGPTHNDEMCNFYMMYFADRPTVREGCTDGEPGLEYLQLPKEANELLPESMMHHHDHKMPATDIPKDSTTMTPGGMNHVHPPSDGNEPTDVVLPRRRPGTVTESVPVTAGGRGREGEGEGLMDNIEPAQTEVTHQGSHLVSDHADLEKPKYDYDDDVQWNSAVGKSLGQISGIALDGKEENVYIFHRVDHEWDGQSFGYDNRYTQVDRGPIQAPTILVVNLATGAAGRHFGDKLFYMPHGITVDHAENVWVTDVALHQMLKLGKDGQVKMVLGKQFEPGHDGSHFCKPTSVAVSTGGDFYVADGYCNSRVIKFTPDGRYVTHFGKEAYNPFGSITPQPEEFNVPHDIKLSLDEKTIFVADRENGRVPAFATDTGKVRRVYQVPEFGFKLFALDVTGDVMVAVNGAAGLPSENTPVQVILVNISTGGTLGVVNSKSTPLVNPHAIVVTRDLSNILVVELNGNLHKFQSKNLRESVPSLISAVNTKVSPGVHRKIAETDGGFSFTLLWIFCVPTLLLFLGLGVCCVKKCRGSSQSKWRDLLYRYQPNPKDPRDLGSYMHRKEGFRPLRQEENFDDNSDSEEEVFTQRSHRQTVA